VKIDREGYFNDDDQVYGGEVEDEDVPSGTRGESASDEADFQSDAHDVSGYEAYQVRVRSAETSGEYLEDDEDELL